MHKYLTLKEFVDCINIIKSIDEKEDALIRCGIDIDSELMKNIMDIQGYNIQYLERLMNDNYETVSWFVYENDYGKKKFEITHDKPRKKQKFVIDSIEAMYDYLVNHNNDEKNNFQIDFKYSLNKKVTFKLEDGSTFTGVIKNIMHDKNGNFYRIYMNNPIESLSGLKHYCIVDENMHFVSYDFKNE